MLGPEDFFLRSWRQFVVFLYTLFLAVFVDGQVARFEVAFAVIFPDKRVGTGVGVFILFAHGEQGDRVVAAGGGAVFRYAASFRRHELAGGAVLDWTQ